MTISNFSSDILSTFEALAVNIVSKKFGLSCKKIIYTLIHNGPSQILDIVKNSALPHSEVCRSLLVLVRYNCVEHNHTSVQYSRNDKVKSHFLYSALPHNIVLFLRYPRFLIYAREKYGNLAEEILRYLADYGRLEITQCIQVIINNFREEINSKKNLMLKKEACYKIIVRLIKESIVERVPIKNRTSLLTTLETESKINVFFKMPITSIGMRYRKINALESELNKGPKMYWRNYRPSLWRINQKHISLYFRYEKCIQMMSGHHGKRRGQIIRIMLQISRIYSTEENQIQTIPVNSARIANDIDRLAGLSSKTKMIEKKLENNLQAMIDLEDGLDTVISVSNPSSQNSFAVNVQRIVELVQFQQIEALIQRRFGDISNRIIKYLNSVGPQEQEQISDACMIQQNETVDLLYKMMKMGFVETIEKKVQSYLTMDKKLKIWDSNWYKINQQVQIDLYHTALNILLRLNQNLFITNVFWLFKKMSKSEDSDLRNLEPQESKILHGQKITEKLLESLITIDANIDPI